MASICSSRSSRPSARRRSNSASPQHGAGQRAGAAVGVGFVGLRDELARGVAGIGITGQPGCGTWPGILRCHQREIHGPVGLNFKQTALGPAGPCVAARARCVVQRQQRGADVEACEGQRLRVPAAAQIRQQRLAVADSGLGIPARSSATIRLARAMSPESPASSAAAAVRGQIHRIAATTPSTQS